MAVQGLDGSVFTQPGAPGQAVNVSTCGRPTWPGIADCAACTFWLGPFLPRAKVWPCLNPPPSIPRCALQIVASPQLFFLTGRLVAGSRPVSGALTPTHCMRRRASVWQCFEPSCAPP